jgi:hypothetical protein
MSSLSTSQRALIEEIGQVQTALVANEQLESISAAVRTPEQP